MAPDQRPACLAVDGFAVHKGHRYATCVMDLGNGDALWAGKGRPEADFAKFLEESGLERLRGVKAVAMDMNASCNKLVKRHMPRADIVYDRCHMHPVRQGCPRRGEAAGGQQRKHLALQAQAETCAYTDRWTLLRKDASLTGNARDALEAILEKHRDNSMKEELSELFRIRGWRQGICPAGMEEMVRLGRGERDIRPCQPREARHQHRQARGVQQPDTGGEADRLRLP